MMNSKIMILVILSIVIIGSIMSFGFISQGNVKLAQVSPLERIHSTISFQNIDGKTTVVGISGISGVNPTLISRTDYNYFLTIYNNDTIPHMFFIDGLNVNSKVIQPNNNDTMIIYSLKEGEYGYYDRFEADKKIGDFKIVKVGLLNQYP